MLGKKEILILQTQKGSSNIKKYQPWLYEEDFWPLDKSQHSSGTCEIGSHMPKEVISLSLVKSTYGSPLVYVYGNCLNIKLAQASLQALPPAHRFPFSQISLFLTTLKILPPLASLGFSERHPWQFGITFFLSHPLNSQPFCFLYWATRIHPELVRRGITSWLYTQVEGEDL